MVASGGQNTCNGGTHVVGVMTGSYCPVREPGSPPTVHGGE